MESHEAAIGALQTHGYDGDGMGGRYWPALSEARQAKRFQVLFSVPYTLRVSGRLSPAWLAGSPICSELGVREQEYEGGERTSERENEGRRDGERASERE